MLKKWLIRFVHLTPVARDVSHVDVRHHGRIEPSSPREEEPKFESPTMNYKSPNTRSRAKFVHLVTYSDNKGMCKGDLKPKMELESSSVRNEKVIKCHNSWRQQPSAEAWTEQAIFPRNSF